MVTFDETITVYNPEYDDSAGYDVYHKTVITGCSWFTQHGAGQDGTALHRENLHKIRIPNTAKCDKHYVAPTEFTDPATQYTLRPGDRIVKGVGADITRTDDLEGVCYDRCIILGVHDNRRVGLKHIYVEGK